MKATKLSLLMLLALGLFYFSGCELTSNDDEDTDPVDNGELPIPLNQVLEAFKIENALRKKGSLPAFNGVMADVKMNTDSIFLIKRFKNRIELYIPSASGFISSGITSYIQVEGSDEYFEVKPDPEHSNDSIAVYLMNFDPGAKEIPMNFKIKWLVKDDDSGVPIDTLSRPVKVETEEDPCPLESSYEFWDWLWTTLDGEIVSTPTYPGALEFQTQGCCQDEKDPKPCLKADLVPLKYTSYAYYDEFIKFDHGTAFSIINEVTQNLNYGDSDFCSGAAAYNKRRNEYNATADYSYDAQKNEIRFSNIQPLERQVYLEELKQWVTTYDRVFIDENAVYELVSCHFLLERKSFEGQTQQYRLFKRNKNLTPEILWYD